MLHGMYANFSSALPSEWTSSKHELDVVDADNFLKRANVSPSVLDNKNELQGNIALISLRRETAAVEKVKHVSQAGAVGVILINTDALRPGLFKISAHGDYKSEIPVLMIKASDATRLRKHGRALIQSKQHSLS